MLTTLMDLTEGVYRVTTETSTYIIDLDLMMLWRSHNQGDNIWYELRRDGEPVPLFRLDECTVGRRMRLFIDLRVKGVDFTFRNSTIVHSIKRIE